MDYEQLLHYRGVLINIVQQNQNLKQINQRKINRIIEQINKVGQIKESYENQLNELLIQEKELLAQKKRPFGASLSLNGEIQECKFSIHLQDDQIEELLNQLETCQQYIDNLDKENVKTLRNIQQINEEIEKINNNPPIDFKYQVLK